VTRAAWWIVMATAISAALVGWYVFVGGLTYKPEGAGPQRRDSRAAWSTGIPWRPMGGVLRSGAITDAVGPV
jgi:hypothetical protein